MAAIRQQTLCLNAVSKAHLRRDQLREWRDRWIRVVGAPVMRGTDRRHISGGSRERRMRRLRNGQLYSAGLARVRIEALLGVRGPPSSDVSKDGSYGTEVTDHPLGFALASQLGFRVPWDHRSLAAHLLPRVTKVPLEAFRWAVGLRHA